MKAKTQKGAGRPSGSASGNVTIDLGETIDKKLRAAGLRTGVGKGSSSAKAIPGRPGALASYRPGMFGGFRPWYSRLGRPLMGQDVMAPGKAWTLIPTAIQQVKTTEVFTGLGLGLLGNRALVRLTPMLWRNDSRLLHEGLAFVAGLAPMLFKRNATTLGVAVPGAVFLGGSLLDLLFNAVGLKPGMELKGGEGAPRSDAAMAARQKLAAIQQRINLAQAQPRSQIPRVVAQPQYA